MTEFSPNQPNRANSPEDIVAIIEEEFEWCNSDSDSYATWLEQRYRYSNMYELIQFISCTVEESVDTLGLSKTKEVEKGFLYGGLLGLRVADEMLGYNLDNILMKQLDISEDLSELDYYDFVEEALIVLEDAVYLDDQEEVNLPQEYNQLVAKMKPGIMPQAKWYESVSLGFVFVVRSAQQELMSRISAEDIDQIVSDEVPSEDKFDQAIWQAFGK